MDANDRLIPHIPEDMGEGIKDPVDDLDDLLKSEIFKKAGFEADQNFQSAMLKNIKQFQYRK